MFRGFRIQNPDEEPVKLKTVSGQVSNNMPLTKKERKEN